MDESDRKDVTKLIQLAKDRSGQARRVLAENISDLFMSSDGRLNEQQYALMSDILCKLIGEAEISVRKELALSLAQSDQAPAELLRLLANDKIEIARPILEKSSLLCNEDLISVVRQRTDEHRLCIAMRARLGSPVSDALIDSGSEDVIEALLHNDDAEISRQAMEYLVACSRRVDRFQEPLLSRHDLPVDLANRMFWWVSAALRRRIIADYGLDEFVLDEAIEAATHKVINLGGVPGSTVQAQKLVARMKVMGELNFPFLISALKQQKIQVFIAGLSELSKVDIEIVWQVFNDKGGEGFAILCKAIGVERTDFTALFLFLTEVREGRKARSTSILKDMLSFYDLVTRPNAEAVVKFWRRDKAYLEAMEELNHAAG